MACTRISTSFAVERWGSKPSQSNNLTAIEYVSRNSTVSDHDMAGVRLKRQVTLLTSDFGTVQGDAKHETELGEVRAQTLVLFVASRGGRAARGGVQRQGPQNSPRQDGATRGEPWH